VAALNIGSCATLHITKQSAQGRAWLCPDLAPEMIVPAARHTDSLGASTAKEKGFAGSAHRRRDCVDVIGKMRLSPRHRVVGF